MKYLRGFQFLPVVVALFLVPTLKAESEQASASTAKSSEPAAAESKPPLPSDIYTDSYARLPLPKREEMDEAGKKVYDRFVSPQIKSLAGLQGPYGIWLHNPKLADLAQPLNYYLRYDTPLGGRLTELAILVTARELNNQFEWTSHEPNALKLGLEPNIIDVVRNRKSTSGLPEKEALIITIGRELFTKRKLAPQLFAQALKVFGETDLVNLTALMGDYASIATVIDAFDIQLKPDQKPLLPIK
jgi:4-carboxymuconolactone decarboxylase